MVKVYGVGRSVSKGMLKAENLQKEIDKMKKENRFTKMEWLFGYSMASIAGLTIIFFSSVTFKNFIIDAGIFLRQFFIQNWLMIILIIGLCLIALLIYIFWEKFLFIFCPWREILKLKAEIKIINIKADTMHTRLDPLGCILSKLNTIINHNWKDRKIIIDTMKLNHRDFLHYLYSLQNISGGAVKDFENSIGNKFKHILPKIKEIIDKEVQATINEDFEQINSIFMEANIQRKEDEIYSKINEQIKIIQSNK